MVHRCQSLIKGDKCGDPKCLGQYERRVVEESTLLTTAVQPQPVKMILLFSARSIGRIHTTEEHCSCVKIRSEFKVAASSVGKGQLTSLVQNEHRGYWQKDRSKTTLVSKADGLHECESSNTSDLLICIVLMTKQADTGENRSWFPSVVPNTLQCMVAHFCKNASM